MKRSQFGDDDVIQAILDEIGEGTRVVCDLGARLMYSNSAHLIEDRGWTGVLVDQDQAAVIELRDAMGSKARICHERVSLDNVNDLVPDNTWVLSIDIDSDDWWVWASLVARPPVVIIETNLVRGMYVCAYGSRKVSKHNYGCSVAAAIELGKMKGYRYLGLREVNAYFLRADMPCEYSVPPIQNPQRLVDSRERNVLCA